MVVDQLDGYQISLKSLQENDLETLRIWRNSPEISRFMVTQEKISSKQQQVWFERQKKLTTQKHFSVFYKNQLIGSANVKTVQSQDDCDLTTAEVLETGLYIGAEKYRANLLAFAPSLLLNDFCFNQLGTKILVAHVHPDNSSAIQYNLKLGYQIENQGRWIEMKLLPDAYDSATKVIKGLLNRPKRHVSEN